MDIAARVNICLRGNSAAVDIVLLCLKFNIENDRDWNVSQGDVTWWWMISSEKLFFATFNSFKKQEKLFSETLFLCTKMLTEKAF